MTRRCPLPADLLQYALDRAGEDLDARVSRHVAACGTCRAEVGRLRAAASSLRGSGTGGDAALAVACLDELALAEVAERGAHGAGRADALEHLASCPRCRSKLAQVVRTLDDPVVAREAALVGGRAPSARALHLPRWSARVVAGLAAAAALLTVVAPAGDEAVRPPREAHREQPLTATRAPLPLAPLGATAVADTLRWTSVPHADRYEVTLFDGDGNVVWQAQSADTAVALPPSAKLAGGAAYLWRVQARTGWDRWVASDLVEFTAAP